MEDQAPLKLPASLMPKKAEACGSCRFVWMEGAELACRRYPPGVQVVMVPAPAPRVGQMMAQQMIVIPSVRPDFWCGEYSPPYNLQQ